MKRKEDAWARMIHVTSALVEVELGAADHPDGEGVRLEIAACTHTPSEARKLVRRINRAVEMLVDYEQYDLGLRAAEAALAVKRGEKPRAMPAAFRRGYRTRMADPDGENS